MPVPISSDEPLYQVQPIHRSFYSSETLGSSNVEDVERLSEEYWLGYRETVRSNAAHADDQENGQYAVQARIRAKQKT